MDHGPPIKECPFLSADEARGYRLFPEELQNDECVAFHGTADAHRVKIIGSGFAFVGKLQSLSFAKTSSLALRYACEARSEASPEGCVLAVRFRALERPGIVWSLALPSIPTPGPIRAG